MGRGTLTDEIVEIAEKHGLKEFSQKELRLMPYIQYVMMNDQYIEMPKINDAERKIVSHWRDLGLIDGGVGKFAISKDFWDAINEILWHAYVNY